MSKPTAIIAIDPGGTTGFATWQDGFKAYGTFKHWRDCAAKLEENIQLAQEEQYELVIVYETFSITQRTIKVARSYDALYLIGTIQYLSYNAPYITAVGQTPSEGKGFGTDKKLDRLGWDVKNAHAKDAARHLLVWLFNNGMIGVEELSGDS